MSISVMHQSRESGLPITIDDFRVPRAYLGVLLGEAEAQRLLEPADRQYGTGPGDETISSVRFLNACLEHMRTSGDESYGVAENPVPLGTFGLMTAAAAQADDFAGALERFVEAGKLLRAGMAMQLSRSRDGLTLTLHHKAGRTARTELMTECMAMTVHCAFRWLTGRQVRLGHLRVAEPLPGFERSLLHRVMGCPVTRQGSGVTMRYTPESAAIAIQPVKYQNWAAQELGEFMVLLSESIAPLDSAASGGEADIVLRVRRTIAEGTHSGEEAARKLGMSPATLRRRLAEAGRSFRAIAAEMQRSVVESLIVTDKPLEDIAAEIGYSDVRSLRRACRRWFGVTPTAYRQGGRTRGAAA